MAKQPQKSDQTNNGSFEQFYPRISEWVKSHGWIEIGQIDGMPSFVLALDEGGLIWEGKRGYTTIDQALHDLENSISDWLGEQYGD